MKLTCCSKNAEPRGGQAQATPKVTNVPKSCHSLTRSSELLLANSQPQVVSRCLISVWIENCSSSPVARNSPRGPKSLRQIEAIPSYQMRAAGVISPEVAVTVQTMGGGSGRGLPFWAANLSDCVVPIWIKRGQRMTSAVN